MLRDLLEELQTLVEFKGQIYSDPTGEYSVEKLIAWTKAKGLPEVQLQVADLLHNIEGPDAMMTDEPFSSRAFIKRSEKARFFPILVKRHDGRLWIVDGSHRLVKAKHRGMKTIRGIILPSKLPNMTRLKPEKTEIDESGKKAPTPNQLENELIIINHHVGDARKYIKRDDLDSVVNALDDIREAVVRLEKLLPGKRANEIERASSEGPED